MKSAVCCRPSLDRDVLELAVRVSKKFEISYDKKEDRRKCHASVFEEISYKRNFSIAEPRNRQIVTGEGFLGDEACWGDQSLSLEGGDRKFDPSKFRLCYLSVVEDYPINIKKSTKNKACDETNSGQQLRKGGRIKLFRPGRFLRFRFGRWAGLLARLVLRGGCGYDHGVD